MHGFHWASSMVSCVSANWCSLTSLWKPASKPCELHVRPLPIFFTIRCLGVVAAHSIVLLNVPLCRQLQEYQLSRCVGSFTDWKAPYSRGRGRASSGALNRPREYVLCSQPNCRTYKRWTVLQVPIYSTWPRVVTKTLIWRRYNVESWRRVSACCHRWYFNLYTGNICTFPLICSINFCTDDLSKVSYDSSDESPELRIMKKRMMDEKKRKKRRNTIEASSGHTDGPAPGVDPGGRYQDGTGPGTGLVVV